MIVLCFIPALLRCIIEHMYGDYTHAAACADSAVGVLKLYAPEYDAMDLLHHLLCC
jgi:hypothetical protein